MKEESPELSISELRAQRRGTEVEPQTPGDWPREDGNGDSHSSARARPGTPGDRREKPRAAYVDVSPEEEEKLKLPFDPVRLFEVVRQRWKWWGGAGLFMGLLAFAWFFGPTRSMVMMQLMRRDAPVLFQASKEGNAFQPQYFNEHTLTALLLSPEVISRVAARFDTPVDTSKFVRGLYIEAQRESELVTVTYSGRGKPQETVDLMNRYGEEFVAYTREMQIKEARETSQFLEEKLAIVDRGLTEVNLELNAFAPESKLINPDRQSEAYLTHLSGLDVRFDTARIDLESIDSRIEALQRELKLRNPVAERLQVARAELDELLQDFTDLHPAVQRKRAQIATLEQQAAAGNEGPSEPQRGNPAVDAIHVSIAQLEAQKRAAAKQVQELGGIREQLQQKLMALSDSNFDYTMVKSRFTSLEMLRSTLASRLREAQLYEQNALGYYHVFLPASIERASTRAHRNRGFALTILAAFFGMISVAGLMLLVEVLDDRIKTAADLQRVTKLPLLATMGDLNRMTESEKTAWAFRTWTILKGKLSATQSQGLVCGFISAQHGEGRTTWVDLLTRTANERGLRVLTIATQPSTEPPVHPHEPLPESERRMITTLSPNVLASPIQVTQQLSDPDAKPVVHIPLPGWVWNLERRKQWQVALAHWRRIDSLILLVELPPACEPEAVLLAESVPQLIWLADSGKPTNKETWMHLEMLQHAGCQLAGTVLNHEPHSTWRSQISRWFGAIAIGFGLSVSSLQAQPLPNAEPSPQPPASSQLSSASEHLELAAAADNRAPSRQPAQQVGAPSAEPGARPNLSFSVSNPSQRARWQERLTLGPGDILNLGLFGDTNLFKLDVAIGPDGRISYLNATDIMAAGLTVDELRAKIDEELSQFYRSPRSLVTPVSFQSKKYFVLGSVMNKGVYTLDRPITLVEALARARGLETGLLNRNSIDLADLQRSFLVRDGQRLPVDFEKLFYEGDLSQNVAIEPNDYIYFHPGNLKEVYVLGEVRGPGVVAYTGRTSVIKAISERGGFTDRAYKSRVLVVRGSLNQPETFVVDTWSIVDARSPDFVLEPRDIVFVNHRPFIYAEDLLDSAAIAFLQSATTAFAGLHINAILTKPIITPPE